ncbi:MULTISPECIES: GNAT family N-acetyltransferase [Parachlamydia]|jgi:predicted acetyltransferase|uniref:N-acetyltransferase domain-containing protein n=2 Tax=Parachlamydia acanthamoebae TaxID=83552 RepID=F8KX00_PARAV|nr:GNAT family N-acetyltransferase [Parachlamydia acanthamoebae]CCB86876.1 putative uncharacterized protein [Parachlamydia acanthamoebae UV-7]
MNMTISKASLDDWQTVQNLARFYVYDMARYCGFLPGWETPPNGLYTCDDLSSYFTDSDRYSFLIKVDHELAGFVLINKVGSIPEVDWNMGEFFVISKFQGKGVGRTAAEQIFMQFPGLWEVMQIPENKGAIAFWNKVIQRYTNGHFMHTQTLIPKPIAHIMEVLRFDSLLNFNHL